MNTKTVKTVKTVVKAFVLFGLVLASTVDVMAVDEQRVQALEAQGMSHEYAVRMAELEEEKSDSLIRMARQKACNLLLSDFRAQNNNSRNKNNSCYNNNSRGNLDSDYNPNSIFNTNSNDKQQ
ncbi:hypothetical protein AGMMS50222_00350 [Endomicrobiia bacterium]|nr:hypothetical protein AGMMS49556_02160 [Endomicrobiia bacterium]GHT73206.1 hypothetical protein AGMMS50222_00350 [Endomicrobiia bacterium]